MVYIAFKKYSSQASPNAKICEFIPSDSSENNLKVVWDILQYLQG